MSPDGRYVAFVSLDQQDNAQTVMVSSVDGEQSFLVADEGAHYPRWAPDGTKIYFRRQTELMSRPITLSPLFSVQGSEKLVADLVLSGFDYFPHPVQQRVLVSSPLSTFNATRPELSVMTGWLEEMKRRLPER